MRAATVLKSRKPRLTGFFSLQARSPARNTAAAWVSATRAHGSSRDQPAVGRSGLLIGITPVFVTFPPGCSRTARGVGHAAAWHPSLPFTAPGASAFAPTWECPPVALSLAAELLVAGCSSVLRVPLSSSCLCARPRGGGHDHGPADRRRGKPNVIGVSASWVGDGVAWVTDIRQACTGPHTILFAPNGPLLTVRSSLTCPLASAVTPCMPVRSQSPVRWPCLARRTR